ncbi:unnamed protein product [Oppiella nova]|uniref:Sugar transporter SWEET1 n=1 Tax=Oppiella nova TaxID=334625 RepID=A0A7R9QQP3_9ACAR|nr:unnamed protein product [Oppiella nova]CAD7654357.1 unnamed protein product [Oppiella nova]CAG2163178.1 unnamed protein product [Oppiella nova]CAG2171544.1 unnamed protein product [Oppiella nova]
MTLIETIALVATIITIISFLSGLSICLNIYRKGSTHEFSSIPFIAGVLCCTLWLRYGYMLSDETMIFVNTIGLSLQAFYLIWFYAFTIKRSQLNKQIGFLLSLLVLAYMVVESRSDPTYLAGLLACISSLVFCAAPLALVRDVVQSKSSEKLPFILIISSFMVTIMWFLYGLVIKDQFVSVTNGIGALINTVQLSLFVIYPNKAKTQ